MTEPRSQTQSETQTKYEPAMATAADKAPGRFVWHDLMSTDKEKATAFYAQLFGWTTESMDMGPEFGMYPMWKSGEAYLGGTVQLRAEEQVPSHWISYITVDNVDAACERAKIAGGKVCVPPTDIPGTGRFAVVEDSTGAYFSPFTFADQGMPDLPPMPGTFVWHELLTRDAGAAKEFYRDVVGWESLDVDMGPMGTYTLLKKDGVDRAGLMQMPADAAAPSNWLPYVGVADVDASAARVTELGGMIYVKPTDIPGIGRFSVCADPTGASFALYRPTK
jgi:uncharacterized protein